MIRPLLPALAFLTLALAACTQSTTPSLPTADVPAVSQDAAAGVTLRLPAPSGLTAQYINGAHTTRVDVQIDGGVTTSYLLGSAQAPCAGGVCTIDLGNLSPARHTFNVGSYGVNPSSGQTVLISQGTVTQTLIAGQHTDVALTLTPVTTTVALSSAVKQYNRVTKAFGNYVSFASLGGRSLPAYYDVQTLDSVGDAIPGVTPPSTVVCGNDASVAITNISDAVHPGRFRVEVQTLGAHTLSVQAGSGCTAGGRVLTSQAVRGVATRSQTVSGGTYHSLALLSNGTVRAWGSNAYGQLGDGTNTSSSTPVTVSGLNNAVGVAGGDSHSLALLADGTVRAWGSNNAGQLGDGTNTDSSAPAVVSGLSDVVSVAGGSYHSLALLADGTVRSWGSNNAGQLGDGTTHNRSTPVQVSGLSGAVSVAGGIYHSLAVSNDGTVRTWGYNGYGQLGDGTNTQRNTPVTVSGLSNAVSVAGGGYHSLAVSNDGTVSTWGYNVYGQLGDGTNVNRSTPVTVSGLSGAASVAGGGYHSLAVSSNGIVRTWGANFNGQLGDGTSTQQRTPVTISGLSSVISVAGGSNHSVVLLSDGTVRTWGNNGLGQLGDGTTTNRSTPVTVSGLSTVAQPTP
ncbi:RCC1 domain-containing protein [Deinococcus altitudinis]|uniref:RCC1 domain-containing protein n=1 Tax=Deinococcus altitudinis TaxID=468914 RepID=UPI0038928F42